jgi:hypothetical protein
VSLNKSNRIVLWLSLRPERMKSEARDVRQLACRGSRNERLPEVTTSWQFSAGEQNEWKSYSLVCGAIWLAG